MTGPFAICFFVLWASTHALKNEIYKQDPAGELLCSETYHETGICKSVMFDINYISCVPKKRASEPLSRHETRMIFKKVSMCVPSCDEPSNGLTTYSVNVCKQIKQNGISHKTDKNPPTTQTGLTTAATPTVDAEQVQCNPDISLYQACEEGMLDVVKHILSQGLEDINSRGKRRRTPVMAAARNGRLGMFDFLVSQGCDLFCVDENTNNVLHLACMAGNADIVRKLIVSEKLDKESGGMYDRRPIMWAAYFGHSEVFDLLARKSCDLKALDKGKNNILHIACEGGNVEIVQFILSQNIIGIEIRGHNGRTPVMTAAVYGHKGLFEFLVGKGCNLTPVDDHNNSILHLACEGGNVEIVQFILSQNIVGIESRGHYGRTPVMSAARMSRKGVFDFLVEKGCKMTAVDDKGNNILHVACKSGHVEMVRYLRTVRAVEGMENVRNKYGHTPVQIDRVV